MFFGTCRERVLQGLKRSIVVDQRLEADWVRSWCEQADVTLTQMMESFQVRHGFPPGTNLVALATDESHQATDALVELTPIPSDLTTMYWVIDEVSLPDVDSGYFNHPASMVADRYREYGAIHIDGGGTCPGIRQRRRRPFVRAGRLRAGLAVHYRLVVRPVRPRRGRPPGVLRRAGSTDQRSAVMAQPPHQAQ
jgi:hypothetical protein